MGDMPNSTQASGDGEERSANDEFMDQFADPDDDYEYDPPPRTAPGLLPGALIGAGLAALCAIGVYLLAGGGDSKAAPSPRTVTYTQDGPTHTVTAARDSSQDRASVSTSTVTLPRETRTVRVVQPGKGKTVTKTATKTQTKSATTTATTTKTTTKSEPPKTETTTVTETKTVAPPNPPRRSIGGQ